jgi:RNA polymerase sigma factor (sigma-70 family)
MAVRPSVADTLLADAASLRRLAESLIGGDAEDLVQEAGAAALAEQPALLRHPGLWLRGTVRKLAARMRRGDARRRARERLVAKPETDLHDPAALTAQAELVRDVGAAVHALDEPFRSVILLRFWHDLPVDAIAARLCVPRNTVRSRLQRGLARLRERLDREHGHRERWAAPLGVFLPVHPIAAFTLCLMNKKLLFGAAAVLLAALAVPWLLHEPAPAVTADARPGLALVAAPMPVTAKSADQAALQREAVASAQPEAASTGTLVVKVQYSSEPTTGSGVTVTVGQPDVDFRVGVLRAATDTDGTARFPSVPPGRVNVWSSCGGGAAADVRAGATTECVLRLDGATLTGIVVDAAGVGVAGALVGRGASATNRVEAEVAAVTAADGTFVVRNVRAFTLIGARASGYAASQLYSVARGQEAVTTLRIELTAAGGCVGGSVLAADGKPVRDAVVRVGEGKLDALRSTPLGAPPLPAQVRTDADGRFLAVGVPVGACQVQVRAAGLGPWTGTCRVGAGLVANVLVRLEAGVTCAGAVRTEAGEPVADTVVRSGRDGDFLQYFARTAADGAFTLTGLPAGEFEVWAASRPHGKASVRVRGEPGASVHCDLVLSYGLALRGRVTDEDGKPISWVEVDCEAAGSPRWWQYARADESGRFVVPDCPAGRLLLVQVSARDRVPFRREGVDPRAGELQVQLARDTAPRARITGRVLGPEGQVVPGVEISAFGPPRSGQGSAYAVVKAGDGSFAIEVTAGNWEVRAQSANHPMVFAGTRQLQAGDAWDLGTIQLSNGGTLVVRDGGRMDLDYLILDARERFRGGIYNPASPRRSELLEPGDHLLLVRGKGIAAQVIPFTIRPGKESEIELHLVAGVRQRFVFVPAPGTDLPPWMSFHVRRDGKLIGYCSDVDTAQTVRTGEIWLWPGDYVLTSAIEGREGTATARIGSEEGPPIRITVR